MKSKSTSEKQTKSGYPTKTTAILFVVKTSTLCVILIVFATVMMVCNIIKSFSKFLGQYTDKVFNTLFTMARFAFGFRYIFENFLQILVTASLEIAAYKSV